MFALVVLAVFQTLFTAAVPLMNGVHWLFDVSGKWIGHTLPPSVFRSLLTEGVWAGVGSVVVFLPQVLLLFLFIGILEDSGIPGARRADRRPHHGKGGAARQVVHSAAFGARLRGAGHSGYAHYREQARPHRHHSDRPVHDLPRASASLHADHRRVPTRAPLFGVLSSRAAALLGLYVLGFFAAVVTARALKSSILKSGRTQFLLEMPSYRWPTLQSLGMRLLDRSKIFLRRAGTVILLVTVVLLWVMAHLPTEGGRAPAIEHSFAGQIGHAMEPVIRPLGFNWKIGIGLITSLAARETIIGTLGEIYGMDPETHTGEVAGGHPPRSDARRRGGSVDLFRVRDAVHLHDRRGSPRNRRVEVAGGSVCVYERAGILRGIPGGASDPLAML